MKVKLGMDQTWKSLARAGNLPENSVKTELYRASGPGGQKRNKTSSAVRLTHLESGISATAADSRSQKENKATAMRRLCHAIVLAHRLEPGESPVITRMNPSNPDYLQTIGALLDHLARNDYSISKTAEALQTSTGKLIDFLARDDALFTHVNRERAKLNLRALNPG